MLSDPAAQQAALYLRARKWRLALITGGALLAAAFFMPAVKGCSKPEVPATETIEMFGESPLYWPVGFCLYTAAYFFGLMVAVRSLASLNEWPRIERVSRGVIGWLLLLGCVIVITVFSIAGGAHISGLQPFTLTGVFREIWDDKGFVLMFLVVPVLGLSYLVASRRERDRRWMGHIFSMSLWCIVWFGAWMVFSSANDVYYGLYCSLGGSLLVWMSVVGEASALADRSYLRTLAGLFAARIPALFVDRGCCKLCGYSLIGLPEPRCPECGTAFDPNEVDVSYVAVVGPTLQSG